MPILKIDSMGNIYQSSPDREDGGGYGGHPECVSQGDLTLGSAYLKSQESRRNQILKLRRDQKQLDHQEYLQKIQNAELQHRFRQKEARESEMQSDPVMREAGVKKALSMGCPCDYKTPMSGNVMTANGQSGFAGMSRDQQVIHSVVSGRGSAQAFGIDPVEKRQHDMKVAAERAIRLKAR